MIDWLSHNWLALFGAATGSLALLLNFLGYRHNLQKDKIKLSVEYKSHPRQDENISRMESTAEKQPWEQIGLVPVFVVTIRNLGNVPAPIEGVGLIIDGGRKRPSLVSSKRGVPNIIEAVSSRNVDALPPLSSRDFEIFLNRGEPLYRVSCAYVVDQTGKTWHSKT